MTDVALRRTPKAAMAGRRLLAGQLFTQKRPKTGNARPFGQLVTGKRSNLCNARPKGLLSTQKQPLLCKQLPFDVAGPGTLCRRSGHITSQVQTQYVAGLQKNADLRHFLSPAADLRRGSAKKHRPATEKPVTCDVLPRHLRRNGPAAQ